MSWAGVRLVQHSDVGIASADLGLESCQGGVEMVDHLVGCGAETPQSRIA
jgi:hypothetical protein